MKQSTKTLLLLAGLSTWFIGCAVDSNQETTTEPKQLNHFTQEEVESQKQVALIAAETVAANQLLLRKDQVEEKIFEIKGLIVSLEKEADPEALESIEFLKDELTVAFEELTELKEKLVGYSI